MQHLKIKTTYKILIFSRLVVAGKTKEDTALLMYLHVIKHIFDHFINIYNFKFNM